MSDLLLANQRTETLTATKLLEKYTRSAANQLQHFVLSPIYTG